ncbi:TrmH family RNA methyltransferase [Altibacter sp. HG106]|uniref:TrmH family RNA methyltransferase n=1 Tax=Altibacter sp. HG106 TaxID=3023937 RepID=UPI0023505ACB|nr:TrmH family RNA methyltransferase [Altibacter sp. HG106]MDC7993479.1 TrmH family RNA methyltransferase [Altibacter sp. HG106]
MGRQTSHTQSPFQHRSSGIHLLCDGVQSPANVGGLFRLAEAFGVTQLYFANASINFNSERLKRTARNTVRRIPYVSDVSSQAIIQQFRSKQIPVYALEITTDSIPLQQLSRTQQQSLALVIGNERHGVSENVLKVVDQSLHIPMFGQNSSMNVIQATAIALYALTKDL